MTAKRCIDRVSVRDRLKQFFAWAPDEELSFADIVQKYGCTLWTARHAVYDLQRDGVLESIHIVRVKQGPKEPT